MYHVILAGGSGSRFWPKSRADNPKQLLKILGDETMIRLTYDRLEKISPVDHILVVASNELSQQIQKEIPKIPKKNYIIEPYAKNTAPAIGLAALHVYKLDSDAVMGVYPADHFIIGDTKFKTVINQARKMAEVKASLITIGIKPSYPATGYGYIQYDPRKKTEVEGVFKVKSFIEKPGIETAEKLINRGGYLWNGGMFVWRAKTILQEIKTLLPELHKTLDAIYKTISTSQYETVLDQEWALVQPESIDYGILEKTNNVYTIEADFKWNDLGSWKSLFNVLSKDKEKNYYDGDVISLHSENNLIISPNRLTAVVGIKDMSIINLEDATLIVPHEHSEAVKDIVNMLKSLNRKEYL